MWNMGVYTKSCFKEIMVVKKSFSFAKPKTGSLNIIMTVLRNDLILY